MRTTIFLFFFAVACGDDAPPPCADVGCSPADHPALVCASVHGPCECLQPDGAKVSCAPDWKRP